MGWLVLYVSFFGDLIEFFVALRLCSSLCVIVGHLVLELIHFNSFGPLFLRETILLLENLFKDKYWIG
jgi:hypothetical protein